VSFRRWPEAVLVAVTLLVYSGALQNGFVWDDDVLVVHNSEIRSLAGVPGLFARDTLPGRELGDYYRPLQTLSYAVDYQLWGLDPFGFHLTSVLIHAAAALLLYRLAARLLGAREPALAAALLWAVHPVHTEAVTYVSGRSDPLAAALMLASLLLFARGREPRSPGVSQMIRTMIHSRMSLGLRAYDTQFPDADVVLIEPPRLERLVERQRGPVGERA
jgi:hypothetical protein